MSRITRKELKHDRFAEEVEHSLDFFGAHRQQAIRYGSIALAVLVLVLAVSWYRGRAADERKRDLSRAMQVMNAPVGPAPEPGLQSYSTEDDKQKALRQALTEVATKHGGSEEGQIAQYHLGVAAVNEGKLIEAEKFFKPVAESGNAGVASLAKMALGQLYFAMNKTADGEKLLREVMDRPTSLVSKEQATIALGKALMKSKPAEGRKLLEGLAGQNTNQAASRAAIAALAAVTGQN